MIRAFLLFSKALRVGVRGAHTIKHRVITNNPKKGRKKSNKKRKVHHSICANAVEFEFLLGGMGGNLFGFNYKTGRTRREVVASGISSTIWWARGLFCGCVSMLPVSKDSNRPRERTEGTSWRRTIAIFNQCQQLLLPYLLHPFDFTWMGCIKNTKKETKKRRNPGQPGGEV